MRERDPSAGGSDTYLVMSGQEGPLRCGDVNSDLQVESHADV